MKLCPKIILEGTRLTHKTDIAFALNEHPAIVGPRKYRYHSPVISAEWGSFSNSPWGRGPINFEPEQTGQAIEVYRTWLKMFELQKYYSWIVDRFHISTRAYQITNHKTDYDFEWLENGLGDLGFVLVYLTRSSDSFAAAREERLKISGNPAQYDDLSLFVKEQDLLNRLVGESRLDTLTLDISDDDVEGAVEKIAAWMQLEDRLYMPD